MNKDSAASYQQKRWESTLKAIARHEEAIERFKPHTQSQFEEVRVRAEAMIESWEKMIEKEKSKYPQYFK